MGVGAILEEKFSKLRDILMLIEDFGEIEEDYAEMKKTSAVKEAPAAQSYAEELKVSNGGTVRFDRSGYQTGSYQHHESNRPQLTVHTTKTSELKVQIYAPSTFDQVAAISDDLKAGKACVVNYEKVEDAEQRRICDFVNGTCYVLDGCAKRISGKIVLYVPQGVDVTAAMTVALTD